MLVLGKIDVSKYKDLKRAKKLLKTFSMFYVRALFKSKSNVNKLKIARLMKTQTYLQNTYKTNKSLYDMIQYILYAINITNNGIIYTNKEQINTIKVDQIFKLVTFGNLNLQKNAIFNEALNFGLKQMRMMY